MTSVLSPLAGEPRWRSRLCQQEQRWGQRGAAPPALSQLVPITTQLPAPSFCSPR